MVDRPNYEYWDYTHKESSAQFRVYKEVRSMLASYEAALHLLAKTVDEKVVEQIKGAKVNIKTQKIEDKKSCKEAVLIFPDLTTTSISFNNQGEIKEIEFSEAKKKNPQLVRGIISDFSFPDYDDPSALLGSPVAVIKLTLADPQNLGMTLISSPYGIHERRWEYEVDRNGIMHRLDTPFIKVLSLVLEKSIP